jgi:site-specific DNA recombinase
MDLNTTSGRLVARLLGSVARNEVEHKAERQSRKMLQSAIDGRYSGGRLPLGYSLGPTKGSLVINPDEARVLREACSRLLGGHSMVNTAIWAAKELGRPIQPVTLKTALTSDLITGFRQHVPQAERDRWAAKRKKGLVSGEPKGTVYKAGWEAILDKETSKAIRSLLNDPARKRQGRRPVKSLLSSLLHCALCGSVLSYSKASYKCSKRATRPDKTDSCGKVAVSTQAIEGHMQDVVKARLLKSDIRTLIDVPEPLTDAQEERKRLEDIRSKFYDLHRMGQMPFEDMVKQAEAITKELEALDQDEEDNERKRTQGIQIIDGGERWEELGIDERRHIIRALYPGVIVYPTGRGHRSGVRFDKTRVLPVSVDAKFRNKPLPGRDRSKL